MQKKFEEAIWTLCAVLISFYLGFSLKSEPKDLPIFSTDKYQEISLVIFKDLIGDELEFEISGPARVVWGKDKFVENDGKYSLKLGQFPTKFDKQFQKFMYTGNTKTGKFYPSDSYPARGVRYQHRRFFETKEAALKAGFVASKLVK